MIDTKLRMTTAERGLSVFVALALLTTAWLGAGVSVAARSVDLDNPEIYTLHLRANTADEGATFGARFTVSTEDGDVLGGCTLEGDETSPPYQYCTVDVTNGLTVSVWQEPDSIPAGYAPVENPIVFDTRFPTTTPHQIDVAFDNQPQAAQEDGEQYGGMVIGATTTCDGGSSCPSADGIRFTVTTEDGQYIGECTQTVSIASGPVLPGCSAEFLDQITGTLVVTEDVSTVPTGCVPKENPILVDSARIGMASHDVVFGNRCQVASVSTGATSDVAIVTTDRGRSVTDACYILVGYGNEGCDENGDGKITYQDVPLGTYTVRQTADLGPGRSVDDFTIDVTGDVDSSGYERFPASVGRGGGSSLASTDTAVDIALITRDPDTGELLTGTCYVLFDASNEGCDENGDGQVTFAAIPYGTYTVHQTRTPAGYPTIDDYDIHMEPVRGMPGSGPFGVPLGFIVKQARNQNAPDTRNVSVVLLDMRTHERVSAGICVELIGASNVGCDEDLRDGQIDFLDVPAGGPYELRFTNLPTGYEVGTVGGPLAVTIDAEPGDPSNQIIFVLLTGPR